MHPSAPASKPTTRTGRMYILTNALCYAGNPESYDNEKLKNIIDKKGKSFALQPQDVMVPISIAYEQGQWIDPQDYPVPQELPLSMIGDKKEGDNYSFKLKSNDAKKIICVSLTCKQASEHNPSATFHQTLAMKKSAFANSPNYPANDRKMLLETGILMQENSSTQNHNNKTEDTGMKLRSSTIIQSRKRKAQSQSENSSFSALSALLRPSITHGPNGFHNGE